MTREEIIRMAREANIKQAIETPHLLMVHELERFAELVAAAKQQEMFEQIRHIIVQAEERGAAAEREACASVAESYEPRCDTCPSGVANAIRARGQA